MVLFLTSSPTGDLCGPYRPDGFDDRNGFLDELKKHWKPGSSCLIISAFPDDKEANIEMLAFFRRAAERSGFAPSIFDLWDCETAVATPEALAAYDVILLGGGHVPTQNAFFQKLRLREAFKGYEGLVIGISAGTMNCADTVYAEPEELGEATSQDYKRWLPGLGLTSLNILPHHQMLRSSIIDGLRLFEDVVFPDSYGHRFISIRDGSYILCRGGTTEIHGEYHIIENGILRTFNSGNRNEG